MEGETTYTVEEAAKLLQESPERVREMLNSGDLDGIPPGATLLGEWKVLLPISLGDDPGQEEPAEALPEDQAETPVASEEGAERHPEMPDSASAERVESPGPAEQPEADAIPVRVSGETSDEPPDEPPREPSEGIRSDAGASGWTTTKQAAKVLGVSRRSVQGYVRRGLLEAQEQGVGVNKTFLISIDSLNDLRDRRSREAGEAAKYTEASAEDEQRENLYANAGEALRHAIDRVEARTAEATELRVRLEITEKAESTLRAELEEARRRHEEVERERDQLRQELEALKERRESPVSPTPSEPEETTTPEHEGAQEAREVTQSAAETLKGPQTPPTTPGAQVSPQRPPQAGRRRAPLWRRVFGR